jgi:hypothetical protein
MNPLIKQLLPTLATALGGPLLGAATSWFSEATGIPTKTVDDVVAAVSGMPPEKLAELQVKEQDFKLSLAKLGYDSQEKIEALNASVVIEVNKTMQSEAASEHWPTYSWRPFIGGSFGLYINSLWLLPLFHIQPVIMNPDIVLAIGGILGVASYFRGKAQADPNIPTTNKG